MNEEIENQPHKPLSSKQRKLEKQKKRQKLLEKQYLHKMKRIIQEKGKPNNDSQEQE